MKIYKVALHVYPATEDHLQEFMKAYCQGNIFVTNIIKHVTYF